MASMDRLQKRLQTQLVASLDTLFRSEDYSDFKIICGSETHRVHKAIIFPRCEYLAASCRFGGQEAERDEITLHGDEPEHVQAMVYYFYHLIYLVPTPSAPGLVFHAHMYALADKYNIEDLKQTAKVRFTGAVEEDWSHDEFPTAIRIAYETTPETDLGLRDIIVDVLLEKSSLLDKKEVETVVKDISELSYELFRRHRQDYSCHLAVEIPEAVDEYDYD